jgi:tRNA A-37 threonylcarbamoyl transferase component Bud32
VAAVVEQEQAARVGEIEAVTGSAPAARAAAAPTPEELDALFDHAPERYLRSAGGRETFELAARPGAPPEWVVKRARERPLLARIGLGGRALGEREHANLARLAQDGFRVPRALGCARRYEDGDVRSLVLMERVEHAETLRERLARADAAERRVWSARLVALVARLHALGWYHRDLYLQHLVLRGDELVLLDVGRARRERRPRERWFVKDVAALLHSVPRAVGARERLRFAARYLEARGVRGRRARRTFLARVLVKERRMAAHVPRAGEDRPWEDR